MATKSRPSFDPKSFLAVLGEGRGSRFEKRLMSARMSMPPPAPRARPTTVPGRAWLDRLGDN